MAKESAVLLKDLWQARKCCLESSWYRSFGGCFGIFGRQACWLAWVNLSLRSPSLLFPFRFLLLLAQLVSFRFLVKIGLLPWSGHCCIPAL